MTGALMLGVALNASASYIVNVNETGNGSYSTDGGITWTALLGVMTPDPSGAVGLGTTPVLVYNLPFLIANVNGSFGDLVLTEPPPPDGSGTISDLIRFNKTVTGLSQLIFYSDVVGGADALADTGIPTGRRGNVNTVVEVGPELNNGITYTPTALPGVQPSNVGYGDSGVTYNIISDVPEPTTMIAGALLLLPFGASTLRILRRRTA
jgi:hypothetical protein